MAYRDDISALGADHHWDFDGDSLDQIGTVNGTDTSILYTSSAIALDATNCAETNAIADRVSIPTTVNINNSAQSRKSVCGWFQVTAIQNPPKRIYGEGDASTSFAFILGWGNNVIFEIDDASFNIQIFSDTPIVINRSYHLCLIFEGNGFTNEVRAYLDGIKQLNADPTNRQPGVATLAARGVAEFADPAGTVAVGGTAVILIASINGKFNHWATFDGANAVLTDTEVRVNLFEKGAIADITIATGTQIAMQSAIDAYSSTLRANAACCIEINAVTGGGNFTLDLSNITFDSLASIHIRYNGTADTLTIINKTGSNASIGSAPFGGTLVILTQVTITITTKDLSDSSNVQGAKIYIEADTGGDLTAGTVIMEGDSNASGIVTTTFNYSSDQPIIGRIRKGTTTKFFRQGTISGPITSAGLTETILLIPDE